MTPVVDFHRHFTGTLPAWFICAEAHNRQAEPQVRQAVHKLVGDQALTSKSFRVACKRALVQQGPAYLRFFELYGLVQTITKPSEEDHDDFYFRAGRAISLQLLREGICARLIVGAHLDIDFLVRRIRNTIRGAAAAGGVKNSLQIRVTFIRTFDGDFKNLSPSLIDALFGRLERDAELEGYVAGLDFCGIECPKEPEPIFEALEQIWSHNEHRASRRRRRLELSVHAGEDLVRSSTTAQLAFLETLFSRRYAPQMIAHGTILWIRGQDLGLDHEQQRLRQDCLRAMATRGIGLEICPTANLRMTLLSSRGHIPCSDLAGAGVRIRIGTDNPILLGTSIRREIHYLRRHL